MLQDRAALKEPEVTSDSTPRTTSNNDSDAAIVDGTLPVEGPVRVRAVFYFDRPRSHYRTGRNAQFTIKADPDVVAEFYRITDAEGWVLGETLEKAVAAAASNPRLISSRREYWPSNMILALNAPVAGTSTETCRCDP